MKVFRLPEGVPAPEVDYANFELEQMRRDEEEHIARLKAWLIERGYDGQNTGRILSTPVADGHASYMLAEHGSDSFLVHLPYGDAYQDRNVQFLPKEEVLARLDAQDRMREIFQRAAAERNASGGGPGL